MRQHQISMKPQDVVVLLKVIALNNEQLYALLALADALRVGKVREKNIAVQELKNRIW